MLGNQTRRRRLPPADRRAVILAAAGAIFAAHDYDRATMRDVARAAGVTTPVLYDHFGSKAELYTALVHAESDALVAGWADPPDGATPEQLFRGTIETIFFWIERHEQAWRLLFRDRPADAAVAEVHHAAQQRASSALAGLFARVPQMRLSAGLDRARADRALAEASKWAVNAVAAWWWDNRDVPREQVVLLVSDLLWRGLGSVLSADMENGANRAHRS